MTYVRSDVVEVWAWGTLVGAVALEPDTGFYAFAYTPGWIETGIELAPLVMLLATTPHEARSLSLETFYRLPAMLADAPPDAFGNALANRWMADQGDPRIPSIRSTAWPMRVTARSVPSSSAPRPGPPTTSPSPPFS